MSIHRPRVEYYETILVNSRPMTRVSTTCPSQPPLVADCSSTELSWISILPATLVLPRLQKLIPMPTTTKIVSGTLGMPKHLTRMIQNHLLYFLCVVESEMIKYQWLLPNSWFFKNSWLDMLLQCDFGWKKWSRWAEKNRDFSNRC